MYVIVKHSSPRLFGAVIRDTHCITIIGDQSASYYSVMQRLWNIICLGCPSNRVYIYIIDRYDFTVFARNILVY